MYYKDTYTYVYMYSNKTGRTVLRPIWTGLKWAINFESVPNKCMKTNYLMLTHFSLLHRVMYNAYNSKIFQNTNDPEGPSPYASPYTFIYFLLFMCVMTLVLLNMFIGFVIVTFQEVGIKAFRETKLDRNQRNCLYFALTTKPAFRHIPKFEWQKKLSEFTTHPLFSALIFIALVCNSIVLSLQVRQSRVCKKMLLYMYMHVHNMCYIQLSVISFSIRALKVQGSQSTGLTSSLPFSFLLKLC